MLKKGDIITMEPGTHPALSAEWPYVIVGVQALSSDTAFYQIRQVDSELIHTLTVKFCDYRNCAKLEIFNQVASVIVVQRKEKSWLKAFMKEQGLKKI